MKVDEFDLEIHVHDTTPLVGMRHCGTYPRLVEVRHLPTDTRVTVGFENTMMKNKAAAIRGLQAVLDGML